MLAILDGERVALRDPADLVHMVQTTGSLFPSRLAVREGERTLTYTDFLQQAWGLSFFLAEAGVTRGARVGLLTHSGVDASRAMLAVLGCGATFVPLNPEFPDQRLQAIARQSDLFCVLAGDPHEPRARAWGLPVHSLAPSGSALASEPAAFPDPDDLAYIMFTSGSTGEPKGVPIKHRGVVNLVEAMAGTLGVQAEDRVLSVTALTFDISMSDHFLAWRTGSVVAAAPRRVVREGLLLKELVDTFRPTLMQATPAIYRNIIDAGWKESPELQALIGGEALSLRLAGELHARCRAVWNIYGPTEITVWATAHNVAPGSLTIPLGKPFSNTSLLVVDPETRQPVLRGQDGELCIGGIGLSPGYIGRSDLTAEKFIPNPVAGGRDTTVYRTATTVRMHDSGDIEYLGRIDFQIKVRGYRVEPGEIEAVLGAHPNVSQVVVVLRDDLPTPALVAYLLGERCAAPELREFLGKRLPEYMVPSYFEWVETFDLNTNGKVDRKALRRPTIAIAASDLESADPCLAVARAILGQPVVLESDLFEHGLDSITASHLARSLEPIFQKPTTLDLIYRGRSITGIRRMLEEPAPHSLVERLEPGPAGVHDPIVLLHTLTGSLPRDLAAALAVHRPVLGIRSLREEEWEEFRSPPSLEELAARAVRALETVLRGSRLNLIGFSFGGVLGLEIAHQWRERGLPFGLLTVINTEAQQLVATPADVLVRRVLNGVARLVATTSPLWPTKLQKTPSARRLLRFARSGGSGELTSADVDEILGEIPGFDALPASNKRLTLRHFPLSRTYQARPLDGKVLLVRRRHRNPLEARGLGWERIASDLAIEFLQTTEHEVLRDENYPLIARAVERHVQAREEHGREAALHVPAPVNPAGVDDPWR